MRRTARSELDSLLPDALWPPLRRHDADCVAPAEYLAQRSPPAGAPPPDEGVERQLAGAAAELP
jgi:hypothetical protein